MKKQRPFRPWSFSLGLKDVQATGEAFSPQKGTSRISKLEISLLFSIFWGQFTLLDPASGPADQNRCEFMSGSETLEETVNYFLFFSENMNKMYGFEGEVKAKYSGNMCDLFTEVYNWLPLCHCLNSKVSFPYFEAVLRIRIRRIHMFLGLPDPDPLVRETDLDSDPSSTKQK